MRLEGNSVSVKGPKGELKRMIAPEIKLEMKDNQMILTANDKVKKTVALWGLSRALIFNMVEGVAKGFEKKLELEGVGYKVVSQGKDLVLSLGFSHTVDFKAPAGIDFKVEKNSITVSGINKELVGQVAADIRDLRRPEPYKGKGIHYTGEIIRRKAGKKAVKGAF